MYTRCLFTLRCRTYSYIATMIEPLGWILGSNTSIVHGTYKYSRSYEVGQGGAGSSEGGEKNPKMTLTATLAMDSTDPTVGVG